MLSRDNAVQDSAQLLTGHQKLKTLSLNLSRSKETPESTSQPGGKARPYLINLELTKEVADRSHKRRKAATRRIAVASGFSNVQHLKVCVPATTLPAIASHHTVPVERLL